MSFSIQFIHKSVPSELDNRHVMAHIRIGDFLESMAVPTEYWQTEDYVAQWKYELKAFVGGQANKAVLLVEMYEAGA